MIFFILLILTPGGIQGILSEKQEKPDSKRVGRKSSFQNEKKMPSEDFVYTRGALLLLINYLHFPLPFLNYHAQILRTNSTESVPLMRKIKVVKNKLCDKKLSILSSID